MLGPLTCLAPNPASHLLGPGRDRRPSLNKQLSYLKVPAGESFVQRGDALTGWPTRVIHRGPMVQQKAHNVCDQSPGHMLGLPPTDST